MTVTEVGRLLGCSVQSESQGQRCEPEPARGDAGWARVTGRGRDRPPGFPLLEPKLSAPPREGHEAVMALGAMEGGGTRRLAGVHRTAPQTWPPGRAGFVGANHQRGLPGAVPGPSCKTGALHTLSPSPRLPPPQAGRGGPQVADLAPVSFPYV